MIVHAFDESISGMVFKLLLFYVDAQGGLTRWKGRKQLNLRMGFLHDIFSGRSMVLAITKMILKLVKMLSYLPR